MHEKLDIQGEVIYYRGAMRTRANSVARAVWRRIKRGGRDKLWTYADFKGMPMLAVAAALSRLAKKGVIRRVRKGVYYVPRESRFGEIAPDPSRVAAAILRRRGIAWTPSGPAAYNGLGLTTQVSPTATFAVDRIVHSLRAGPGARLRTRLVPTVRSVYPYERALLDALRDIRWIPDASASEVVRTISELFRSGRLSFRRIARIAKKEPPRVRALLGAIGEYLDKDRKLIRELKESLNPTTSFRLGMSGILPTAHHWNIR